MSVTRRPRRARDERGAVAILVALTLTSLLVVTGLVLDFGLVRLDKQSVKSVTDSAATAGIAAGDKGTGQIHTFHAVCGALSYLKATNRLESLPDSICSPGNLASNTAVMCDPAAAATHAAYDQTITSAGVTYRVVIKSPYVLTSDGWSEESVPILASDQSTVSGCDQVGVQVFEARVPGFGSLAGVSDLRFGVRSVARAVLPGSDSLSPALLLLERTGCSALTVGSAGSGASIAVKGFGSTPGSIHVDSDATGPDCGSGPNQQLMQGKQSDGVVAYGSALPIGVAGVISSYATYQGVSSGIVSDSPSNVNGTVALSSPSTVKSPVVGRERVTRSVVDVRYRDRVRTAIAAASGVWDNPTLGWTVAGCNPNAAQLALTTKLWIDCPANSGITLNNTTILASEVYFNGFFKAGSVEMPNASRVYVSNTTASGAPISSGAIALGNSDGFCIRATCSTGATAGCSFLPPTGRARLFVRQGSLKNTGGLLRMCNTTAFMLGGDKVTGCVPASDGAAPTATPCLTSPTAGNSQIEVTGGGFDWTAPNQYPGAIPTALSAAAWSDFEDLAMWSESAGLYKFVGGGGMNTVGVFMVPNAFPVQVGGSAGQTLNNAQFIARTFAVSGSGTLSLTTDPKNAVSIPAILTPTLIR